MNKKIAMIIIFGILVLAIPSFALTINCDKDVYYGLQIINAYCNVSDSGLSTINFTISYPESIWDFNIYHLENVTRDVTIYNPVEEWKNETYDFLELINLTGETPTAGWYNASYGNETYFEKLCYEADTTEKWCYYNYTKYVGTTESRNFTEWVSKCYEYESSNNVKSYILRNWLLDGVSQFKLSIRVPIGSKGKFNLTVSADGATYSLDPWWNSSWLYRRNITIDNTLNSNILTDYQVAINLTYSTNMQPDFSDIRFTWYNSTDDTETEIPYWIESYSDSSWAYVWVKVPNIPASGYATIYVYYGNTTPVSSQSTIKARYNFIFTGDTATEDDWDYYSNSTECFIDSATGNPAPSLRCYAVVGSVYVYKNVKIKMTGTSNSYKVIVEWDHYNPNAQLGNTIVQANSTGYGNGVRLDWRAFNLERGTGIQLLNSWTSWNVPSHYDNEVLSSTTWYHIKATMNGTHLVVDNVNAGTTLTKTLDIGEDGASAQTYVGFQEDYPGGDDDYIDNFKVYQVADPEPTYSIGEEEMAPSGPTQITDCTTITSPGEYVLANDITASDNVCILINAPNVVLDCQNYMISGNGNNDGIRVISDNVTVKNCKLKNFRFALQPGNNQNIENIYCEDVSDACVHGAAGGQENITIINLEVKQTFPTSWSGFYTGANGMRNVYIRNVYAYAPSPIERVIGFVNSINITVENVTAVNISMVVSLENNNSDVKIRNVKAWGEVNVGNHFLSLSNSQNVEIENVELFNTAQSGIGMQGMKNVVVRNATIYNAQHCIQLLDVENVSISDSVLHDASFRIIGGGYNQLSVKNLTVENIYAYNSNNQLVDIDSCEGITLRNITAYNTTGIRFLNCSDIKVVGITLNNSYYKDAFSQSENITNVLFQDNVMYSLNSYLILTLTNASNVVIDGNKLYPECYGADVGVGIVFRGYNYNVTIRNNYAEGKNYTNCGFASAILPSVYSNYNENFEYYNNNFINTLQVVNGKNFKVYNNSLDSIIIYPYNWDVVDSYIHDNLINHIDIGSIGGRCLRNIYAYNNTYSDLAYYSTDVCLDNVFMPDSVSLEPYIEIALDHNSVDFGLVQVNNLYSITKGINISTNRMDYYLNIQSSGLIGPDTITQDNIKVGIGKEEPIDSYQLPLSITPLKQFSFSVAKILYQLFVPFVRAGNYSGNITIDVGLGSGSIKVIDDSGLTLLTNA